MKPDLVLIAIPDSATADTDEAFAGSYAWTMNWSLNFGPPTWDSVVIHPSVTNSKPGPRDELIRRLVAAQDLVLIDRKPGNTEGSERLVETWLTDALAGLSITE